MKTTTKRLLMLAILTMSLAIPALAIEPICVPKYATCPSGATYGAVVCCEGGSAYADCGCTTWSASGGYGGCELIVGCT